MNDMSALSDMPMWALVALVMYGVFQIGFEIYALVVLFNTPEERLAFGKRWMWVLIILFINLIGAVVFLVAGRKPVIAADQPGAQSLPDVNRARRATDVLYGGKDGE